MCAEHKAKLGGGFCSLLYYVCNGPVVSKAMKINSKLLQISGEELMETAEKHEVETHKVGFLIKDRTGKAQ